MNWLGMPGRNPLAQFVYALTDWLVQPLRPGAARGRPHRYRSLVAALLVALLSWMLLFALRGVAGMWPWGSIILLSLAQVLRWSLYLVMWLTIIHVLLSWINPYRQRRRASPCSCGRSWRRSSASSRRSAASICRRSPCSWWSTSCCWFSAASADAAGTSPGTVAESLAEALGDLRAVGDGFCAPALSILIAPIVAARRPVVPQSRPFGRP